MLSLSHHETVEARPMKVEDLGSLTSIASPAISPDGKRAIFITAHSDFDTDKTTRELQIIDLTTHAHHALTYERSGVSAPTFSPDGTRVAFIAESGSGEDAQSQVFIMPLDGGDARPVTRAPEGVEQYAWSPDGKTIAYAAEDEKPKLKGGEKFRDSFVFTTEPITQRKTPSVLHLWVVPSGGGIARQITHGPLSVAAGEAASKLSWSADSATIAFEQTPNAILNDATRSRVTLVDVATEALSYPTGHSRYEGDAQFAPSGDRLAYDYSTDDNQITLTETYVTTPKGGSGVSLSHPLDRAVRGFVWAPDASALYTVTVDGTSGALTRIPLQGAAQRIDLGDLQLGSGLDNAIAHDGTMVFAASSSTQPAELYVRAASGGAPVRLTDFNASIAALDLAHSDVVEYPTSTGVRSDAVLLTPPGFTPTRRYPLVLLIHGGPTSASVRAFDTWGQTLAARGWLVLEPNYRGSDNHGLAFQSAVRYDPDAGPGEDIMAALDAVRARGIVDEKRLGVAGWSYGGIMTAWMISKYHIWKAAVSGASVNDWATDYGTADDSDSDVALFHGSPFLAANAEEYRKASAITYAKDVTTPTLILSDIGDNRDPFATSSMYYRALRDNGKDVTLVAYPVDGHFPGDLVRREDVYTRTADFIAAHF
jgi:dipeptidyl aminopeptidase/acylaminoacyl peptidase